MSDLIDVVLPPDQVEGTRSQVHRWLKAVGEQALRHEPLVEIETDKVTVEVPSPADGVLAEIVAGEGAAVEPGAVLARLRAAAAAEAQATVTAGPSSPAGPAATRTQPARGSGAMSPAVRRLLGERGLTAAQVKGSGEGGRITVEDVLAARLDAAASATLPRARAPEPAGAGERVVPHTPMRRRIAAHMVESLLHTAPHVTNVFQCEMSAVLADRAARKADFERRGLSLTLTAYFVAACVDALRAVPEANARWSEEAILLSDRMDIGIATALGDRGLVVPVIRDAGALDLAGIAGALGALVEKARNEALTTADLKGGSFTISNHGVSGSLLAAPIVINQPQSAILGVGKLEKRAVVVTEAGRDAIAIRPCCYVTLTIDHRVLDGFQANRFMQVFVRRLEGWDQA